MKRAFLSGNLPVADARDTLRRHRLENPIRDNSTRGLNVLGFFVALGAMVLIRGCVWLVQHH